jgi:hypothetical protein
LVRRTQSKVARVVLTGDPNRKYGGAQRATAVTPTSRRPPEAVATSAMRLKLLQDLSFGVMMNTSVQPARPAVKNREPATLLPD